MRRYGLFIDLSRCIGCYACVVGCKNWHKTPVEEEAGRIVLKDITRNAYPNTSRWIFPVMCMHCSYPPCVAVCRFNACRKKSNGIVFVDAQKCIGCELCTLACPYNARHFNAKTNIAYSCDLCADRIESGGQPYCVETCPMDAMAFGDIDDPQSNISLFIETTNAKPLGKKYATKPNVFYAGFDPLEKFEKSGLFR